MAPSEDRPAEPTGHLVTDLLHALSQGDRSAFDRLLPIVYAELKVLARSQLRRERSDHTLQPTALVHEAFLKLAAQHSPHFRDRAQFFGVAAKAMRRILVDYARTRKRAKRDGGIAIELTPGVASAPEPEEEVLAIHEALETLALREPRQAQVVELRYFGGLNVEEAAAALDLSTATVKRDWVLARAWLKETVGLDP